MDGWKEMKYDRVVVGFVRGLGVVNCEYVKGDEMLAILEMKARFMGNFKMVGVIEIETGEIVEKETIEFFEIWIKN